MPLLHERGPQRRLERQVARARLRVAVVRPREAVVHRVIGGLRLVLGARGARGLRVGELDVGIRDVAGLRRHEDRDRRSGGHHAAHAPEHQPAPPSAQAREHAPRVALRCARRVGCHRRAARRPVRRAAAARLRAGRRRAARRRRRARPAARAHAARARSGRRGRRRRRGRAPGRRGHRPRPLRDRARARRRLRLRPRARPRRDLRPSGRAARRAAGHPRRGPAAPRRDRQRHRAGPRRRAERGRRRARGSARRPPARAARRVLRRRPDARLARGALRGAPGLRRRGAHARAGRRRRSGDRERRPPRGRAAPGAQRARPARRAAGRPRPQPRLPARGLRSAPARARRRARPAARRRPRRPAHPRGLHGRDGRRARCSSWLDDMGFVAAERDLVAAASRFSTGAPLRAARTNAEIARAARGAPVEAVALAGGENARRWLDELRARAPGDQRRRPAGRRHPAGARRSARGCSARWTESSTASSPAASRSWPLRWTRTADRLGRR